MGSTVDTSGPGRPGLGGWGTFGRLLPRAAVALTLAACGGGGSDPAAPAAPSDLSELMVNAEEADADVTVEVLRSSRPATITTQVNPSIGGQTVYEVAGTTSKGTPFKAVMLGDEGLDLGGFKGPMRLQGRVRQIQGQTVLAGRLLPRNAGADANPIAFVAGASSVSFTGPAAGTVYQFNGTADFKGSCGDDGLSGSYVLRQGNVELTGSLTGVREPGQPPACTPGPVAQTDLPVSLSYTAVETHMGIVFSFQGSLSAATASRSSIRSAGRESGIQAAQVQLGMPAQGVTVAGPSLPATTLRASSTLKSNVRQLANKSGAELVSFDAGSGRLVFNRLTGNLTSLAVNDIISSAPRPAAPNGFLRKVTSIRATHDGKVEVHTARANVAELLDEADIAVDQPFDAVDVQRAVAMERGQLVYAAGQKRPAFSPIQEDFLLVLYDQDGDSHTTDDQITVSGSFRVQPRVVMDFKCRRSFCSDPYFLGKFVLDEDAVINVSARLKKELRESRRIARIPLPPVTAGPLVIVPDIVVTVDVEGLVKVHVEVGATQSLHLEAGVRYDSGFEMINTPITNEVDIVGPIVEGSVDVKAGIYAALRLMLFGVAGVSAEAGPYMTFEAQYPGSPAWTLTYGIEGNLGVDIDLLILRKEWEIKLFDKIFTGKTKVAPDERPTFLGAGSKNVCDDGYTARIGVAVGGAPAPVGLYALTDDKEDGLGSGTIDWSSSLDGPLGRTRKADKHQLSAALRNGTHTITALLTDSFGNTRTRDFTVQLGANRCEFPSGLPVVDIISDDNPLPVVALDLDGALTLRARTRVGPATPLCTAEITWKSSLANGNAGRSTGVLETVLEGGTPRNVCTHTFAHVYKNHAPQTITATISHNGMSTSDSIEVGVLIPVPPSMGDVLFTAPSGTRYVYEGDTVSFSASGTHPVWTSSVEEDDLNGRTGNNVSGSFDSIGQRTIVARIDDGHGGFVSRSITINVLSALARP